MTERTSFSVNAPDILTCARQSFARAPTSAGGRWRGGVPQWCALEAPRARASWWRAPTTRLRHARARRGACMAGRLRRSRMPRGNTFFSCTLPQKGGVSGRGRPREPYRPARKRPGAKAGASRPMSRPAGPDDDPLRSRRRCRQSRRGRHCRRRLLAAVPGGRRPAARALACEGVGPGLRGRQPAF